MRQDSVDFSCLVYLDDEFRLLPPRFEEGILVGDIERDVRDIEYDTCSILTVKVDMFLFVIIAVSLMADKSLRILTLSSSLSQIF